MTILLISTAIVLALLGAYARAVAATPPDEYEHANDDDDHWSVG